MPGRNSGHWRTLFRCTRWNLRNRPGSTSRSTSWTHLSVPNGRISTLPAWLTFTEAYLPVKSGHKEQNRRKHAMRSQGGGTSSENLGVAPSPKVFWTVGPDGPWSDNGD